MHAQIAASNALTGLESVTMLRVMIPTVSLVLGVVGLAAVALRLTGRPVAAFIAPALLVAGAYHLNGIDFDADTFFEPYLSRRFVSSPSHSYGVMMSMPALMLLLEVLRPNAKANRYTWVTLTLALLALSGAKATYMPVFVCGAIGLWLIHLLIHRRIDRVVSALTALLIAVTLFAQFIILGGQTGGMALDPFQTAESAVDSEGIDVTTTSVAAMSLALLVSWLLYGVGVVGLLKGKRWLDPRAIWMLIAIPTGIAVPFLLFRTGLSQLWFSRTVAELIVLISAWGLAILLPRPLTTRRAIALGGRCCRGRTRCVRRLEHRRVTQRPDRGHRWLPPADGDRAARRRRGVPGRVARHAAVPSGSQLQRRRRTRHRPARAEHGQRRRRLDTRR